ncbi:MAG TPA: hypothetical protein VFK68_00340 [Propionibacteriaceae bacterium]|nr:hypothetical protein [Propionibacteriaceae bacterium]
MTTEDDQDGAPVPPRSESPLHPVSLVVGAASAAAAAVIGGRLGLSGTVAGAAVGSVVAAVAATAVKHWATRGRDALLGLTRRPSATVPSDPAPRARVAWPRRAVLAGGGFAVGIVGLLAVQLALGTPLSRGTGQLQEAAAKAVPPTAATTHRATTHSASATSSATSPAPPASGSSVAPPTSVGTPGVSVSAGNSSTPMTSPATAPASTQPSALSGARHS